MTWTPGALLKFETERLIIRSMAREDVSADFISWLADPDVMVGLNLPRQRLTRAQAVRWVLGHNNINRFIILVIDKASEGAVGFFTMTVEGIHRTAETSVVIGNHEFWGKNVVVEARTALLDFLFDTLDMHKVIGRPHGRNFSSIFNYKAMGFTCEAVLRQHMRAVKGDARLDQLVFGILKEEWQAAQAEKQAKGAA